MEQTLRICIIGAGACGLTTGKNLLQAGLRNFVIYDKGSKVGGNWVYSPVDRHSSVYEFTHTISSKSLSQFPDFPFPENCPDYPSHAQVASYFEKYAQHFGINDHVRFGTEVTRVRKLAERNWQVTLADGTSEQFEALFVCNGHHWSPRLPDYPGSFNGRVLHSHDFKEARSFAADRVLVVGAGNSGCDIAVKMAEISRSAALSLRRGYHIVPKFILGLPSDVFLGYVRWIPRPLLQRVGGLVVALTNGKPSRCGLPEPDHRLFASHPVINSHLTRYAREKRLAIFPDIERLEGHQVRFVNGATESFDTIIFCTGYEPRFPFFDQELGSLAEKELYLRMFAPGHPDLFFIGLFQPIGCIWPLADLQAKLAANALLGNYQLPAAWEAKEHAESLKKRQLFISSPRHSMEVDFYDFRRNLRRQIARCSSPA